MKLNILILILIPWMANSQLDRVNACLILGPNISWIGTDDNTIKTENNRLGFKIQVQGEYLLNERYSLTGGLGLSLIQGGKLKYAQGGNLWSESKLSIPNGDSLSNGVILGYKVNYMEIPIGFKMRTSQYGKYRFYAQLPEFSLGIRLRARGDILEVNGLNSSNENIKSQILFLTFNWGLGIGTEYQIKDNLNLILGVRYMQSLLDVTDDSGRYFDGSKQNSNDRINNLDFRIGLIF
ncbi:MAG: porin family protein [Saprospiraceae bacterium]